MASIMDTILTNLVAGGAKYAGEDAAAWVLNGVLGDGGPTGSDLSQVLSELSSINQKLGNIYTELTGFFTVYQANVAFGPVITALNDAAFNNTPSINGDFKTFAGLQSDDGSTAKTLADNASSQADNLNGITTAMLGQLVGQTGDALSLAANVQLANLIAAGIDTSESKPLMNAYNDLQGLFDTLFQLQVQGLALVVNGYNAQSENDLAVAAATTFMTNLQQQGALFLSACQSLAAGYHSDDTFFDMLIAGTAADPIRSAQVYLNGLTATLPPVPRVWIWNGSGEGVNCPGWFPPPPEMVISGASSSAAANAVTASPLQAATTPWTASRYEFSPPVGDGPWNVEMMTPSAGVVVASGTAGMPYDSQLTISFTGTGGNDNYVPLANLAALGTAQNTGCLQLPTVTGDGTWEVWFFPQSAGTIFSSNQYIVGDPPILNWSVGYDPGNDGGSVTLWIQYDSGGDHAYTDHAYYNLRYGAWNHLAVTVSGVSIYIYTNGNLVMGPGTLNPRSESMPAVTFLADNPATAHWAMSNGISGYFNELRVWNRALAQTEIYDNMYQALSEGDGLVAAYGFECGNVVSRVGPALGPNGSFTYVPRQAVTPDTGWTTAPAQQYPAGR